MEGNIFSKKMVKPMKTREWKEFQVGGKNGLFTVKSSVCEIDLINLNTDDGSIPYITRSNSRNGIAKLVKEEQNEGYIKNKGNVITIGLDTQTVFYQPVDFFTGQNIQIIDHPKMNESIAQFLIPLFKTQLEKFNWGGNGATLRRLNALKIMLPVTKNGNPDWEFMEHKGAIIYSKKKNKILKYLINKQEELKKKLEVNKKLDNVKWKGFTVEELFQIKSGVRLTKKDMIVGKIPFIGASDSNNGITNFVQNINNSLDKNVLGVNYNGSVVESFYHPYYAIFSDDVKRLSLKNREGNKYIYLFVKTMILKQKNKYMYAYKFNARRMNRQKIMLPVTNKGTPDWDYMELYMKKIEYKKLDEVIAYLKNKKF